MHTLAYSKNQVKHILGYKNQIIGNSNGENSTSGDLWSSPFYLTSGTGVFPVGAADTHLSKLSAEADPQPMAAARSIPPEPQTGVYITIPSRCPHYTDH